MPEDVRELVDRSIQGDQSAIVDLVERFQGLIFGLCFRLVGHRQDAEDMAQETFIRALRSLPRWDRDRSFEPWLMAIAGNRCRTLLAKRMRRPAASVLGDCPIDRRDDMQAARQLAEEVERALVGLREEYRQAFLLFHEQELGYAEIGEVLDCPVGTAKTWVHRARKELIDRLHRREVVHQVRHAVRKV